MNSESNYLREECTSDTHTTSSNQGSSRAAGSIISSSGAQSTKSQHVAPAQYSGNAITSTPAAPPPSREVPTVSSLAASGPSSGPRPPRSNNYLRPFGRPMTDRPVRMPNLSRPLNRGAGDLDAHAPRHFAEPISSASVRRDKAPEHTRKVKVVAITEVYSSIRDNHPPSPPPPA
eukprot:gene421-444_t